MLRSEAEIRELVLSYVEGDPLYEVLKDTPQEEILFSDDYLKDIIEKKGYPMLEIAEWFNISDGQLRYYLRPFHDYIFEENGTVHSSINNVLRLNIGSILKLRMLILLKEEYRVKGLKQLLGLDGEGYFAKPSPVSSQREVAFYDDNEFDDLKDEVERLQKVMQAIFKTGLFKLSGSPENPQIEIDDTNVKEMLQELLEHSNGGKLLVENIEEQRKILEDRENELNERLNEVGNTKNELVEKINELGMKEQEVNKQLSDIIKIKEEYDNKMKQLQESTKEKETDLAKQLKKVEVMNELRAEALRKWNETNNYGVWARISKANKIELEKEEFIKSYVEKEFSIRFEQNI